MPYSEGINLDHHEQWRQVCFSCPNWRAPICGPPWTVEAGVPVLSQLESSYLWTTMNSGGRFVSLVPTEELLFVDHHEQWRQVCQSCLNWRAPICGSPWTVEAGVLVLSQLESSYLWTTMNSGGRCASLVPIGELLFVDHHEQWRQVCQSCPNWRAPICGPPWTVEAGVLVLSQLESSYLWTTMNSGGRCASLVPIGELLFVDHHEQWRQVCQSCPNWRAPICGSPWTVEAGVPVLSQLESSYLWTTMNSGGRCASLVPIQELLFETKVTKISFCPCFDKLTSHSLTGIVWRILMCMSI